MGLTHVEWLESNDYTLQSASGANGDGTVATLDGKYGSLTLQVKGATWTGTLNFEATQDGTNYIAIEGVNKNTGAKVTTATGDVLVVFDVTGVKKFKARQSGFSAGTVTATATATAMPPNAALSDTDVTVTGSLPAFAATPTVDTELPAAALLADGAAMPTTPTVGAVLKASNGTTLDTLRADAGKNLQVRLYDGPIGLNLGTSAADAIGAASNGALFANGFTHGFNGTTWDRLRSGLTDPATVTGLLNTLLTMYDANGPVYRALRAAAGVGDGSARTYGLVVANYLDNGATLDRQRNNTVATPLASALRSASTLTPLQTNYNGKSVSVTLDITARTIVTTPQVRIVLYDAISSTIAQSADFDPIVALHRVYIGQGVANAVMGVLSNARGILPIPIPRDYYIGVIFLADVTNLTYSIKIDNGL